MINDRPFTRWRLRPKQGEPAHGYFARLMADEGHRSVKIYATEIGLNGRKIVPEEMLEAILMLPLAEEEFQLLRAATPRLQDTTYVVGNERLHRKQMSFTRRRYCQQCLADAPYHRIQWDVTIGTHCAVHRVPLVSARFDWWWPHFDVTPMGESMISRATPTARDEMPFHDLLRNRLEFGQREGDQFAAAELCDIIATVKHFAQYVDDAGNLAHPVGNRGSNVEAAFSLMTMNHADRVAWFRRWYETIVPTATLRRGYYASTRVGTGKHHGRIGNLLWDAIEQAQYEGFAQVGALGRHRGSRQVQRSDRTLGDVANEIGIPVRGLRSFVRDLRLLPDVTWNKATISISPEEFQQIKALADDLITLPQTLAITGIPGHEFRQLAKAGFVREIQGMTLGGVGGPKYFATEVRLVVDRLRALAEVGVTPGMRTLCGYARKQGISQGQVVAMTLRGELKPAGIDRTRNGLRSLYY